MILTILLVLGCKSKQVTKTNEKANEVVLSTIAKDSIKEVIQSQDIRIDKKIDTSKKESEKKTEIEIKGKAETDKPLELYQIENGDTLQAVKILGNAEVFIKTKHSEKSENEKSDVKENFQNKLEDFSRSIVSEKTLKETANEIKETAKSVQTKTGSFWSFGLIAIFGVVALVIIGLIIYFKK